MNGVYTSCGHGCGFLSVDFYRQAALLKGLRSIEEQLRRSCQDRGSLQAYCFEMIKVCQALQSIDFKFMN